MPLTVTRHFATLGLRQVHYRRAGEGPAVILLHQSPQSSSDLLPLIERLAARFTVLAPDMPGYGASDRAEEGALTVPFLADGIAAFMDEIGIERAAVYGHHTGASVATSLARRHPRRVAIALCEGLLCLEEEERGEFAAGYLKPFEPHPDGSHLAWLWTRLKDQSIFFPWHQPLASTRLDIDGTPLVALDCKLRDWLRSGEGYAHAYAAAIAYDPRSDLSSIRTPHHVLAQRSDPLTPYLARLPPLAENVTVHRFATAAEGHARVLELLLEYRRGAAAGPRSAAPARPLPGRAWRDYITSKGLQLQVLRAGAPCPRATVVQHDAQSSLGACPELLAGFAARGPTVAVELPGHGESDPPGLREAGDLEWLAGVSRGALEELGVACCDFVGVGAGAALQVEMTRRWPRLAGSLTLIAPIDVSEEPKLLQALSSSYVPPQPDMGGGHLLRAWHEVRDHLLFFPWYERRRSCALDVAPRWDARFLQARTVAALLAGEAGVALRRAELRYPLRERLHGSAVAACVAVPLWEPRHRRARELGVPPGRFLTLSREERSWAREIERDYLVPQEVS